MQEIFSVIEQDKLKNVIKNEKCVIVQTRKNEQKQHFYSNNNQTHVTTSPTKTTTTRQRKRNLSSIGFFILFRV